MSLCYDDTAESKSLGDFWQDRDGRYGTVWSRLGKDWDTLIVRLRIRREVRLPSESRLAPRSRPQLLTSILPESS